MSGTPLFRTAAALAQRPQTLGRIVLTRPLSYRLLTGLAVASAVCVGGFLYWGTYTQRSTVAGQLVPDAGLVKVHTPQAGVVVEKKVKEGQTVRLKFDAFPYVRFGSYPAQITRISRTPLVGASPVPDAPDTSAGSGRGKQDYVAWAVLPGHTFTVDGEQHEILPGMQATASIVVERRSIAEWVLEPVFRILRG